MPRPRGVKPKPTHLKLIQGTARKNRLNPAEPKPALDRPMPPQHLMDETKVEWGRVVDDLYQLGIITKIDRSALAAYCQAFARWMRAERALAEMAAADNQTKGLLIRTATGNVIQNPLVGIADLYNASVVDWGMIMAAGLLVVAPVAGFFVFIQKFLVAGWGAGGVKG